MLVSSTVKDLVAGSGLAFADMGPRALKGTGSKIQIYQVSG